MVASDKREMNRTMYVRPCHLEGFQRTIEVLSLREPLILPILCHKSTTTSQIDSFKVSNFKLKPDLYHCVRNELIESAAPPQ